MRPSAGVVLLVLLAAASCKKSPMGRVEQVRDELAGDGPRWDSALPSCANARPTCAVTLATAIGAPFDDKKPDQVSAAVVAILVARDRHGSDVASPDVWLAAMRIAKGPGADALRLAVALEMSQIAAKHARPLDTDAEGRGFLADVASVIPGACPAYEWLGAGTNPDSMRPEDSPDHSACIQHDLSRKEGPGGTYGQGLFRGVAAGLALWKDALAALHEGAGKMDAPYKTTLESRLGIIDAATSKISPKAVLAPLGNVWGQTLEEHKTPLGGTDAGRAPR